MRFDRNSVHCNAHTHTQNNRMSIYGSVRGGPHSFSFLILFFFANHGNVFLLSHLIYVYFSGLVFLLITGYSWIF